MEFNLANEIYSRRESGWKVKKQNQYYIWFKKDLETIKMSKETGKIIETKTLPKELGEKDP